MSEIGFYFEKFQTNEDPEPQLSNKVEQFSTCHAEVFTCLGDGHNGPGRVPEDCQGVLQGRGRRDVHALLPQVGYLLHW